ncbi:protoporphyrinogen oxidase [Phocicoccus pinnipedialis]|uniref:Coproporphyrinogen III oxidase n=1 Tax=Phocicoccus pinnipedialis TaxID=110845 RepID=A0A6V7RM93_9BACL|nr:protoporphyrinogen oxidase [Jeotgalicoccus pinnipedialis]MBP1939589.1 oxygen-dependent protoporphyrinogen oxidase [Jeotgalicoccus pinnipedialis]CAD2079089.1 Protoporphyrinogen oxidase [Jeotgalicoccus pinnipedialis]
MKKVAIVGAGITGLSAAYYLSKAGASVDVFEASDHIGGKIKTYRKDGYVIELGPESYISRKQSLTDLAKEIGMESHLVRNETGQAYIYTKRGLTKVPKGTMLGVPTTLTSFLKTDLLSPLGKARGLIDYVRPPVKMNRDLSAGQFFRKRLGNEITENMIQPLLSGVYSTDIDEMSLMSTYPFFKTQEEKYRSLIKGMFHQTSSGKTGESKKQLNNKQGMFFQFKGGLESFIDRLVFSAKAAGAIIEKESPVKRIEPVENGYRVTVNGKTELYDEVIVTTMHHAYKNFLDIKELEYFKHMKSTTVANIVMAFNQSQVRNNLDGTGFVISRNAGTSITACTWTNKKWAHSTPEGKALLRLYIGKPNDRELNRLINKGTDAEIIRRARNDLDKIMNIEGEPEFSIVTRMPNSAPNYLVGHKDIIDSIHDEIDKNYKGLHIIGAPHYAVGLPDCVKTAKVTADKIMRVHEY